jgi:Protein of unknown function (DUF2950)
MRSRNSNPVVSWSARKMCALLLASIFVPVLLTAQSKASTSTAGPETFPTAQAAAEALIGASDKTDPYALLRIFGQDSNNLLFTNEPALDKQRVAEFAAQARQKNSLSFEPNGNHAYLLVGNGDWPFPIPIVKTSSGKWHFDTAEGRQEVLYRRIGQNELDAIQVCDGFVEAQHDYAMKKRAGYDVNQYAQRIISTPGTQDGLAWQNKDGSWGGPIGEKVALAISEGYSNNKDTPYHGYYFKVLKGQGPAAPLGQLDYVIKGMMIGGFALVASPAEYRVSGVKTFMVSQDGVVWQKDLGPDTLDKFKAMDRFNPDSTWSPVIE